MNTQENHKEKNTAFYSPSALSPREEKRMELLEGVNEIYQVVNHHGDFWARMQEKSDYQLSSNDYYNKIKQHHLTQDEEQAWEDEAKNHFSKMPSPQYKARRVRRMLGEDGFQRILNLPDVERMNAMDKYSQPTSNEFFHSKAQDKDDYDNYYPAPWKKPKLQDFTPAAAPKPLPPVQQQEDEQPPVEEDAIDESASKLAPAVALASTSNEQASSPVKPTAWASQSDASDNDDSDNENHTRNNKAWQPQVQPLKPQASANETKPTSTLASAPPSQEGHYLIAPVEQEPQQLSAASKDTSVALASNISNKHGERLKKPTEFIANSSGNSTDEEAETYNTIFDLYTTAHKKNKLLSAEKRGDKIDEILTKTANATERKTGYKETEREAQLVKNAIVAVQFKKGGKFEPLPPDFDLLKTSYYCVKLDKRLLYKDTPETRAHEMVDILYRQCGDAAQQILDMPDKIARAKEMEKWVKNSTYGNTPISLNTANLPANKIRYASANYVNANEQGRAQMKENTHYLDAPNVDSNDNTHYFIAKKDPNSIAAYEPNADNRKNRGYDMVSPLGSPKEMDDSLTDSQLMGFVRTNSVFGGSLDGSLPELRNKKGELVEPAISQVEYAREALSRFNSSSQAYLHEAFHSQTNAPLLLLQTSRVNPETGESLINNKIVSYVPGVPPNMHVAKVPEMLNTAHAFKKYVRENFPNEVLQDVDDFEFLYEKIWRPMDKSVAAARIRATMPRDARILCSTYNYLQWRNKQRIEGENLFETNKKEIQKMHPELKEFNDIYEFMPRYVDMLRNSKEAKINEILFEIIRIFHPHDINKDNASELKLFKQWFKDNKVFPQAMNPAMNFRYYA